MRKILGVVAMVAAFVLIIGIGVTAFAQGSGPGSSVPTMPSLDQGGSHRVGSAADVRGNCDEAEHASDAACRGTAGPVVVDDHGGMSGSSGTSMTGSGADRSGPSERSGSSSGDD